MQPAGDGDGDGDGDGGAPSRRAMCHRGVVRGAGRRAGGRRDRDRDRDRPQEGAPLGPAAGGSRDLRDLGTGAPIPHLIAFRPSTYVSKLAQ